MDEPLEHLVEKTGLRWHLQLSHFVTQAVPAATVPRWAVRPHVWHGQWWKAICNSYKVHNHGKSLAFRFILEQRIKPYRN